MLLVERLGLERREGLNAVASGLSASSSLPEPSFSGANTDPKSIHSKY